MDQRQVFKNEQELLLIVSSISNEDLVAYLLIDKDGLTRIEGKITSLIKNDDIENTSIVVNDSVNILLKEIIGINGAFRSDFSEC
jgi:hypothetical protein